MQVATAAVVVPHPEKVAPNSKARIHRDFGYGGEDAYYCSWGPRRVLTCIADSAGRHCAESPWKRTSKGGGGVESGARCSRRQRCLRG